MTSEPDAAVRLSRLALELGVDRDGLEARSAEAREIVRRWSEAGSLGRPELVLLAVNLHGWYTALETAMERIARLLDQTVPTGPSWHIDLVAQMQVDVAGLRPAVVPTEILADLHELRKFRHFFRNAYLLELDPTRVRNRADELARAHGPVAASLGALLAHIRAILEALNRG